ncbi:hypothetical protein HYDPIDRAFT_39266 [Hydnomerulius pinastri MD-312]|nr:hypothetical protein HYDPIDRAFT_39266 [Hydnomerulius pinastri MD-312]
MSDRFSHYTGLNNGYPAFSPSLGYEDPRHSYLPQPNTYPQSTRNSRQYPMGSAADYLRLPQLPDIHQRLPSDHRHMIAPVAQPEANQHTHSFVMRHSTRVGTSSSTSHHSDDCSFLQARHANNNHGVVMPTVYGTTPHDDGIDARLYPTTAQLPRQPGHGPVLDSRNNMFALQPAQYTPSNSFGAESLSMPRNVSDNWAHMSSSNAATQYNSAPSLTTFQNSSMSPLVLPDVDHFVPPSDSTGDLYPYASPHFIRGYSSLPASPSEASGLGFSQLNASLDDLEWFNVQLTDIEFPKDLNDLTYFFQCRWENCGCWISSDKEPLEFHLKRKHGVGLKGDMSAKTCCKWLGCSGTPLKKGSLLRHIAIHLELHWECSECKQPYTRPDSVSNHVKNQARCGSGHAVSVLSPKAYKAEINGNSVTLTKVVQSQDYY